jgi:uncharacterized membrane protein
MELPLRTIITFLALLTTGLSAGLFYAWQVSVIPGTKRVSDQSYLETMQHINRAILNPWFMFIFIGALAFLIWSTYLHYQMVDKGVFILLLLATLSYAGGTFAVTAAGNVPLNNWLDPINLTALIDLQLVEIRANYEVKWNRYHLIRTVFSVISFSLLLVALLTQNKN